MLYAASIPTDEVLPGLEGFTGLYKGYVIGVLLSSIFEMVLGNLHPQVLSLLLR